MTNLISRRPPPPLPQNLANLPWNTVRVPVHKFLEWVTKNYSGIPGGFKNVDPAQVQAGVAADPSTIQDGWASATHVHSIETAAPSQILLGQASVEGAGSALARASGIGDTITLQQQVRALVSLRVG
jgi:hypothetical protein